MAGPIDDNFPDAAASVTELQRDRHTVEQAMREMRRNLAYQMNAIHSLVKKHGRTALVQPYNASKKGVFADLWNAYRTCLQAITTDHADIPTAANLPADPVEE